jgi:hypothetical protein
MNAMAMLNRIDGTNAATTMDMATMPSPPTPETRMRAILMMPVEGGSRCS